MKVRLSVIEHILAVITKDIFKLIAWITGVIAVLLLCFHLWFIHHSEKAIQDLITWQSHGKLHATIKKFRIDYINNKAEIKDLVLYNTDTLRQGASYRFTTKQLRFNIRSKWELIFHKHLIVDSVMFVSPDITITRRQGEEKDSTKTKILLAEELGNIYNIINKSLSVFNLKHFEITEGKLVIRNAVQNGRSPFEIAGIFLSIEKLQIDSTNLKNKKKLALPDRLILRVPKQRINFPDKGSYISFSSVLLDSKQNIIQITDPYVSIYQKNGQKNSIVTSASKLNITGLDFNTLYQQPLIKIDSLYLENSQGELDVYTKAKGKDVTNKKRILADSVLRNLPVGLTINNFVMRNGNSIMRLHQGEKTTFFQTRNDNLDIVGIHFNDTAKRILDVEGFNYMVRNYVGYTPDSAYRFQFDSLQFINRKIVLHNLKIKTNNQKQSVFIRNYTIPRIEITEMDWLAFTIYKHFKAKKAVLYNPVIETTRQGGITNKATKSKKSVYQALSVMDDVLELNELKIVNGSFTGKRDSVFKLHIDGLNVDVNARALTSAKSFEQLINSVNDFSFDTAVAINNSLVLQLSKTTFSDKDQSLLLRDITLNADNNSIVARLVGVAVNDFSFDDNELEISGIRWEQGSINVNRNKHLASKTPKENKSRLLLSINNVSANNTSFSYEKKDLKAEGFLKTGSARSFSKNSNDSIWFSGLFLSGKNARVSFKNGKASCDELHIADGLPSTVSNVVFRQKGVEDSMLLRAPMVRLTPDISKSVASNSIIASALTIESPELFFAGKRGVKKEGQKDALSTLPKLNIQGITIDNATIHLSLPGKKERGLMESKGLAVTMESIVTRADKEMLISNAMLRTPGVSYKTDKTALTVDHVTVSNITATTADLKDPLYWLMHRSAPVATLGDVHVKSSNTNLMLHDVYLNGGDKHVTIGSLAMDPGASKDDFIAKQVIRKDYVTTSSGKITMDIAELDKHLFHISHLTTTDPQLSIYSDRLKTPPPERVKPLPVNIIRDIPIPLQIDDVRVNNMTVTYTERNASTKKTGSVNFTHMNGSVQNIYSKPGKNAKTLQADVTADLLSAIPLHVTMDESYTDPLNTMNIELHAGAGDLRVLNPVVIPFVSLNINNGALDTMNMSVTANEYTAKGNMQLHYHKLYAALLDSGSTTHQKFKTKLITAAANHFAIRNGNERRDVEFAFDRNRQKSTIGYMLKMVTEGVKATVAPGANKISIRKQAKKKVKNGG